VAVGPGRQAPGGGREAGPQAGPQGSRRWTARRHRIGRWVPAGFGEVDSSAASNRPVGAGGIWGSGDGEVALVPRAGRQEERCEDAAMNRPSGALRPGRWESCWAVARRPRPSFWR
jgi:hypothetical protein